MARAKRTDRAEARRRHRAEVAVEPVDSDSGSAPEESGDSSSRRSAPRPTGTRAQRPSALRAFRDAYQPADIRGDLKALPELLRSRAVYLPALFVLISTVVYVTAASAEINAALINSASASPTAVASAAASPGSSGAAGVGATGSGSIIGVVGSILALLFLQTPPIGGIYLAGVLAKRSSYIAGGIAGLLGAIGYTVYALTLTLPPELTPPNFDQIRIQVIEQALITSTIFGILIGGGLGYYRRLLRLMNPTPDRPRGAAAKGAKPASRRR